jgi:hypothetical protein
VFSVDKRFEEVGFFYAKWVRVWCNLDYLKVLAFLVESITRLRAKKFKYAFNGFIQSI